MTVTPFVGTGPGSGHQGLRVEQQDSAPGRGKGEQVLSQGSGKYRFGLFLRRPLQELQQQRAHHFCAGLVRLAAGCRKVEPVSRIFMD